MPSVKLPAVSINNLFSAFHEEKNLTLSPNSFACFQITEN